MAPNAVVLAVLLSVEERRWWLFLVTTLFTEIAADVPDYPLWAAAGYGLVNFFEAAFAAKLLLRFVDNPRSLADSRDLFRFLVIGPFLASGLASMAGAAIYFARDPTIDYLHYWRVFWLGDALGLLVVGTLLLAWQRPADVQSRAGLRAIIEAAALAAGLLVAAYWSFAAMPDVPRVYLVFPFLVWAAIRFGVRGALLAVLTLTAIAIKSTLEGRGPFAGFSAIDNVILLQGLIAVIVISALIMAFAIEGSSRAATKLRTALLQQQQTDSELRHANAQLERINRDLDTIVADRTCELRRTIDRNDILLKEIHHRVKNNLQLVSSLISHQYRAEVTPETRNRLSEVQGQLRAIAATYDVLHRMESVETADICEIVRDLCRTTQEFVGGRAVIQVETRGSALVEAATAVALSLALNELITNSIKHAGPAANTCIRVDCRTQGEHVAISVADDGTGFPPGFDIDQSQSFGIRMVHSVLSRVGGTIRMTQAAPGAVVEVRAPLTESPPTPP